MQLLAAGACWCWLLLAAVDLQLDVVHCEKRIFNL